MAEDWASAHSSIGGQEVSERPLFFLDTNLIDDTSDAMLMLWDLYGRGAIRLAKASTMDRELDLDSSAEAEERRARTRRLESHTAVWVLGVSSLGLDTKLAGESDVDLWDRLWSVLSPGRNRPTARTNHLRDALHIHTAISSGARGFITLDGSGRSRGLLDHSDAVAAEFGGFMICTPAEAISYSRALSSQDPDERENISKNR